MIELATSAVQLPAHGISDSSVLCSSGFGLHLTSYPMRLKHPLQMSTGYHVDEDTHGKIMLLVSTSIILFNLVSSNSRGPVPGHVDAEFGNQSLVFTPALRSTLYSSLCRSQWIFIIGTKATFDLGLCEVPQQPSSEVHELEGPPTAPSRVLRAGSAGFWMSKNTHP